MASVAGQGSVTLNVSERRFQCADCSVDDPQWASLNRGVLICSECCYVHRNLGRQISHVRSLQKGHWNRNQLELMYVLYANNSNRIWEHTLVDPQNTAKPQPKPFPRDPILPVKEAFIKEKYANSAYLLRPSKEIYQEDLDTQLWACVRTSSVVTTLRLLAWGADPNYADPEKQNAALHIAAKEGQALQAELLWIYGADAGQVNASDLTPAEIAKLENNNELAARLEDLRFEVTDRLSMFLCARRPDHAHKQHFLVPELIDDGPFTSAVNALRRRLSVIPSHCFERIVQDVYDEVDRRETVDAWHAVLQDAQPIRLGNELCVAVFLPPNPEMSATRNQLRQKLAKCGIRELATLIVDILKEAKRRHFGLPPEPELISGEGNTAKTRTTKRSGSSDAIFDSVNHDYDDVPDSNSSTSRTSGSVRRSLNRRSTGVVERNRSMGPIETLPNNSSVSFDDFLELKERVMEAEGKLAVANTTNENLLKMLNQLQTDFDHLTADNLDLRKDLKKLRDGCTEVLSKRKSVSNNALSSIGSSGPGRLMTRHDSVGGHSVSQKAGLRSSRFESDPAVDTLSYDDSYGRMKLSSTDFSVDEPGMTKSYHKDIGAGTSRGIPFQKLFDETVFPDNLIVETERLTRAIKLLLTDAQIHRLEIRAPEHAHAIALQVHRILAAVPASKCIPEVTLCLDHIRDATVKLSAKCSVPSVDVDDTCNAAYDVAKAAKNLLVAVHER